MHICILRQAVINGNILILSQKITLACHTLLLIFFIHVIFHQPVFHRMYVYVHYSNFPQGREKKKKNDQKQVDDKKYACTQDRLRFT